MPVYRLCIVCGRRTDRGPRCPEHILPSARRSNSVRRPGYTSKERARRKAAVDAHKRTLGNWCPGWGQRPAHDVIAPNILTADHEEAVAAGGAESGRLIVRCRSCNSSKGAR